MTIEQVLEKEIEESKRWVDLEKENSTYKRDLTKENQTDILGSRKSEES